MNRLEDKLFRRAAPVVTAAVLLAASPAQAAGVKAAGVKAVGIDHVGINVPDLRQAEQFFGDAFGCVPVTHIGPFQLDPDTDAGDARFAPRADSVTLAMLRCGLGANIELFAYRNARGSSAMPKAEDSGASHIAFYTDDITGAIAWLKSQGVTVLGEPITMPAGDTEGETWVHFRAPWGAELELVSYPKGKGYEKRGGVRLWNPKRPAN